MSNAFVIIKMCYVYNQWYDISCATLYIHSSNTSTTFYKVSTGYMFRPTWAINKPYI